MGLVRDVAELLIRPVGRPSHKPVVRYKGFLYQAESWTKAWQVVAKVEFHAGELFPRVGFIVTNLETDSRAVWLLLAEGHLTRRLFGEMVRRGPEGTPALPLPTG